MKAKDITALSLKQLNEKKLRTALTVLMVVIGVASIVALTSLTAGVSQNIQNSLASLGPTSIIITSSGTGGFTTADIANLETLPNVSSVTPIVTGEATLLINGNSSSVTVIGITTSGLQTLLGGSVNLYQGSLYQDDVAPLAVIGHNIAFSSSTNANLQTVTTGESATLEISGEGRGASSTKISIPIVGILQSYSSSIVQVNSGILVSMPFADALLHKTTFNEILVKANNVKSVSSLSALITRIYGTNARVTNTQQLASTASSITGEITLLFTVIAGVSLVVAAIGIMNVMFMAVSERVHDIGILKAIGFRNRDVLLIFLFQALIIGFLGGAVGIVAGAGASYSLTSLTHSTTTTTTPVSTSASAGFSRGGGGFSSSSAVGFERGGASGAVTASPTSALSGSTKPVFTPSIIAEAIIIAVGISALAGIYPAWRASKMQPIEALRQL